VPIPAQRRAGSVHSAKVLAHHPGFARRRGDGRFGQWTETTNVGSGTIEQLDDAIHRIAREYLSSRPNR
jgi:hypothetical protein